MPETLTEVALKEGLSKVIRQIVEQFYPQRIVLFGSYAYGEPHEGSDLDLLVVMETEENPLHAAARIAASIEHPFPLDILVIRPSDLEVSLEQGNVFETEVIKKGITLYEAKGDRVDRKGRR